MTNSMSCKHSFGIPAIRFISCIPAIRLISCISAGVAFLLIFCSESLLAQNVYPASGDALIHRLTIGTGRLGLSSNTALGDSALFSNLKGDNLTAVGMGTLSKSTTGTDLTAIGYQALYN